MVDKLYRHKIKVANELTSGTRPFAFVSYQVTKQCPCGNAELLVREAGFNDKPKENEDAQVATGASRSFF